jgi:putative NADPH-quinone reductase
MGLSEAGADQRLTTGPAMLFACSPRGGGNSDTSARAFAQGIVDAGGTSEIVYLREKIILPCKGCSLCDPSGICILAAKDDVESLFDALLKAPFVFFASPIYFYHLPALFKGFIDRAQSYYFRSMHQDQTLVDLPRRRAYVSLCAGRPQGERLFEGSLLTLKYFLDVFRFSLHDPVLFRSMDGPNDFAAHKDALNTMRLLGREAWMNIHE